jgi:hypothetical protein
MFEMLPGFEERVITVVTPAEVARRAATILVDMPPVPNAEPALDTITLFLAEAQIESERKEDEYTICCQCANVFYHFDGLSVGIGSWVFVIETVDVSHEKEVVSVDHSSCDGGQGVIVAKFDFGNGYGVVFIDYGYNTHFEELSEGILSIEILSPLCKGEIPGI